MTVQRSPSILVADTGPVDFELDGNTTKVKVGVVFFSTKRGEPGDEIAAGSGSRDLTITHVLTVASSIFADGNSSLEFSFAGGSTTVPNALGGSITAIPARTLVTFDVGVNVGKLRIASAAVETPVGSVSYRIMVVNS